jgi:DNA-binding protein H-NS
MNLNNIDLDSIDLVTLKKLADSANEKFKKRKEGELKTLVSRWLADAAAVGYGPGDVLAEVRSQTAGGAGGKRRRAARSDAGKSAAPKYRGPNGELWSGRGQPPKWMKPLLVAGKKKEDFLISKG